MSVNRWRWVKYVGDGCFNFQCLKCYEEWTAHTEPGGKWKYCPYCGTQWEGQHEWKEKKWKEDFFYYPQPKENQDYLLVIQRSSIFDTFETEWKDSWDIFYGDRTTHGNSISANVLSRWRLEIEETKENNTEDCRLCITQLRLVKKKAGQPDKVVLQYLPIRPEKVNREEEVIS